ncbi:MAG: ATP-binding protein [Acidovorax sp.]|uniref:sensor histidine kinase n=1 Tax=Acidovorax sp. TaxID=1872122 RepID=UPI0039E3146F
MTELERLRTAHDDLLRAVAHDLRAPLRHVTSYGALVQEALQDAPPTPALQEALGFLATMDQSARRMGRMIDGLQAISRARRAVLRWQPVPLADVLPPGVVAHIAPDLPTLHADPDLLRELLAQLLDNAAKFTRHTAQPSIRVQADAAPPGRVAFTVADNGAGFDMARAGALFGIFQRLHRASDFDGVGAGLALCRTIAERHGGTISADAAVGQGCTVRVEWPAVTPPPVDQPA